MPSPLTRRAPRWLLAGLLAAALAAGCASPNARPDYDPLEGVNRKIFWFNLKAQKYVLDPVARVWHYLPDPVERSVARFFANLGFPIDFINNLLQGKPRRAGTETARFVINSTVGIAGFFDPAAKWGIEAHPEDFGQTLGVWGLGAGPYLMLPLWGPSNVRESIGLAGDYYGSLQPFLLSDEAQLVLAGVSTVNAEALDLEAAKRRREAALDYYVFVRNAYYQRRQAQIKDSNVVQPEQEEDLYDVDFEEEP